jgi:hypothetical protein
MTTTAALYRDAATKTKMKNEKVKAVAPITTLAELKAAIDRPLTCTFEIDGREVSLLVKRINVMVDELRRSIVRAVTPPWVKERNDYDLLNQAYRRDRENAEDTARSVMVYHCCPEVADGSKGLTDPAAIHAYVKNLLPPMILELIALTALAGGMNAEVKARANFTSTPASES